MQFSPHFRDLNLRFSIRHRPNFAKIQFIDGSLSSSFPAQSSNPTPAPPSSDHNRNGHPFSVGGGGGHGDFVNVAFDGNENSVVVIDAAAAAANDVGMENGNVIIKSGSVTAANGKVERSAGSPAAVAGGEDGGVQAIFGLREECAN